MIGWEKGARFLEQSREEVEQKKNNPWLLLTLDWKLSKETKSGSREQAYQRRYDDIEVSKMHVFAVPEFWREHIDEKLTRKKKTLHCQYK